MAQRFGGKFSPDGKQTGAPDPGNPYHGQTRSRAGGRANALFILPLPLVIVAFFFSGGPVGMAASLAALGALLLAAWLTREGLLAEDAYHARKVARRPAIPRKLFGSVLTGLGLAIAGWAADGSVLNSIIFAVLGFSLHTLSFGLDPMTDKGMEGIDTFQQDRVAKAVDEAEGHLKAMSDAIKRAGDRALEARVDGFAGTARKMFRTVEEDPRDLTAARKYLGVYLNGAREATAKFADLYGRGRDPQVRTDFESLLDDLEQNFAARTEKLLIDDRSDLDVEIEVLRERLQREGVRTGD